MLLTRSRLTSGRLLASCLVVGLLVVFGAWLLLRSANGHTPSGQASSGQASSADTSGALPLSDEFEGPAASAGQRGGTTLPDRAGTTTTTGRERTPLVPPGGSLVATAVVTVGEVSVWATPDESLDPAWRLPAETEFWGERHFLVLEDAGDWLRISVPARPNGSEGWIPRDDVRLSVSEFVVRIHLEQPSLQVWRDETLIFESIPAIGNERAPTPLGRWFIRDILAWDPSSVYGPWVLALSAYSDSIDQINGSDAVVAIHGTNRPDLLGQAISLGCIRLHNDDVTRLAQTVPVGTVVEIVS